MGDGFTVRAAELHGAGARMRGLAEELGSHDFGAGAVGATEAGDGGLAAEVAGFVDGWQRAVGEFASHCGELGHRLGVCARAYEAAEEDARGRLSALRSRREG